MAALEQTEEKGLIAADIKRKLPAGVKLLRTLRGHTAWIEQIAWSPDGKAMASASGDQTIRLWDTEVGTSIHILEGHKGWVYCVAFDAAGKLLVSGSWDQTLKLWELPSGKRVGKSRVHRADVRAVACHSTGVIASGCDDHTIKLWKQNSKIAERTIDGHRSPILTLAFHPLERILASGSDDPNVELWKLEGVPPRRTLDAHQGSILSVAFNSKGSMLASGSKDKTIKLWDPEKGKLLRTLEGHKSAVVSVAFSADGRVLGSKGSDNSVRLWCVESGLLLATITAPTAGKRVPGLAFHPSLPLLATVTSDVETPERERDQVIQVLELDIPVLLKNAAISSISCTSAKIVLVGESNVGKSYLAHRIATGTPPEEGQIKSTHGMKFWPLEPGRLSPSAKAPTGQRRDVVLWDMGGQEEYRLIHQLFLHDTTVALVLLDPTRGATAFKEVETWNKYLDKQLKGRAAVKLLVGAKLDTPASTIDQHGLERLCYECGFLGYHESSSLTGRGLDDLCEAMAKAIDWESLGQTSRPELFQAIRDEIEARRRSGIVVVPFEELNQEFNTNEASPVFHLIQHEIAMESDVDAGTAALDAVCGQLSKQGIIADCRTSGSERALVLRLEEVERYAGSLILAARNNPRGVPALELKTIAKADFVLPGIEPSDRLPSNQERPVLECTLQLMLEHGICFRHEGLLIFPSLFAPASETPDANLPHAISLYYDFAGAIDNIYASLIAWLVLAQDFGRVRLWASRAEFEVKNGGLCGLRKVGRPGGFAHVDVYFETETPERQRKEFISFVEDHLARNGVDIREHVAITCMCGNEFSEETLRQRIARGDKDVICPVCERRHSLTEGAAESRERDPKITQRTWALRTHVEKRRERISKQVVQVIGKTERQRNNTGPIHILHLSDLHFSPATPVKARLQWLLDDLKHDAGLGVKELDFLVISGDFTDRGCCEGFEKAYEFVSGLTQEFGLSAERCIFVPGNHDVVDRLDAYARRKDISGLERGEWFKEGKLLMARDYEKYGLRFKPFSDSFYHKFLQRQYPVDFAEQGIAIPFLESGIQFLTFNSCWQIDEFYRKRSHIMPSAVAHAIQQAQKHVDNAHKLAKLEKNTPILRIAVWHHAVSGPEQMKETEFVGNLQKVGVRLALHGDVHEERHDRIGYTFSESLHVVGSGSFGARAPDRPESTPRLYNFLEIERNLKAARVHTRCQPKPDGPWDGWHKWPSSDGTEGRLSYYDIKF